MPPQSSSKPNANLLLGIAKALATVGFYALMALGLYFMIEASLSYVEMGTAHPFVLEKTHQKQNLLPSDLWLTALYLHVPSALFGLPACLVLLLKSVRSRFPKFHRHLGRVTGVVILFGAAPSGLILAFSATGGLSSTLGFMLTGLLAAGAMVMSIKTARDKKMVAHRRYSIHVAAQMSVAVLSRLFLVAADAAGLYGEWVYIASLWAPVIVAFVGAELIGRPRPSAPVPSSIPAAPQPHATDLDVAVLA